MTLTIPDHAATVAGQLASIDSLWAHGFMRRALLAAFLVGLLAPSVGVYLVQRRLALIGDGLGHVALAGVAIGLVTANNPVWTALIVAVAGACVVEWIRTSGRTGSDSALAIMFYGGIAAGLVVVSRAPDGTPANLNAYLFGSITTTTRSDVILFAALAVVVVSVTVGMRRHLFAASNDDEFARASGLPIMRLNLLVAVLTAVTVVVSMRVVGLLLVSALMVVPVAAAQQFARSFTGTMAAAIGLGVLSSVGGVATSRFASTPSGPTIILWAVGLFVLAAAVRGTVTRRRGPDRRPFDSGSTDPAGPGGDRAR